MADAKGREAWAHTSVLLALIANVNRDPKKHRAFRPDDFNPYASRRGGRVRITTENIGLLKDAFIKRKGFQR